MNIHNSSGFETCEGGVGTFGFDQETENLGTLGEFRAIRNIPGMSDDSQHIIPMGTNTQNEILRDIGM
jgi:hypothetical protein